MALTKSRRHARESADAGQRCGAQARARGQAEARGEGNGAGGGAGESGQRSKGSSHSSRRWRCVEACGEMSTPLRADGVKLPRHSQGCRVPTPSFFNLPDFG